MSEQILYTYFRTLGNIILLKYRKNGKSFTKKIDFYKPSLYLPTNSDEFDATTIYGERVKQKQFESIKAAKDFAKSFEGTDGISWSGNSDFANQFIIELYKGQIPHFDPNAIRVGILDIEVHTRTMPEARHALQPINGITIYDNFTDTYYCMGLRQYVLEAREDFEGQLYIHDKEDKDVGSLKVVYTEYDTEEQLIRAMLGHFQEFAYDITSGWNSKGFDMVYIVQRCYQIVGEDYTKNMLSPFGKISLKETVGKFGKEELNVDIMGLPHLDYLALYKKHIFTPRDSYKLDNIAFEELGEQKLDYEEEGSLWELHLQNPQKFYAYNIKDVKLIKQLDDKLGLFALTMTLAYYCLCNYEDTLATVKPWEAVIAKQLYNTDQVPPYSAPRQEKQDFEGAYVKQPVPGFYHWLMAFDYNSLYPMLEIQCNIGSETYVPRHKLPPELRDLKGKYTVDDIVEKKIDLSAVQASGLSMTANFEFYTKDKKSVIAVIKDDMYKQRKVYKKKMLGAESNQQLIKEELKKRGIEV